VYARTSFAPALIKTFRASLKVNGDSHHLKKMGTATIYFHLLRALGLDRAYISNVENGKQNLTISTMEKVAKALGVSVDQLLKK